MTVSEIVLRHLPRPLALLLAAVLVACTGQPPVAPASASSAAVAPSAVATVSAPPAATPSPQATTSPTASPAPTPSASPVATPTATAPPTPAVSPMPTPSAAATPRATVIPSLPSLGSTGVNVNTGGLSGQAGEQLRAALDRERAARSIPGVTAAVIFPDGSVWSSGSGYAKLPTRQRATNNVPFVVGSITKTFIAAAVMQLDDEGALSIDDPLSKWLPDYPRAADMTLRHLLAHTSGVFNYFEHRTYNTKVFKTMKGHFWTPQEILDHFDGPAYFAPGAGYRYSNTNYVLLGLVIQDVTGKSVDAMLRERFFTPLALAESYFQYERAAPSTAAHGYLLKSGTFRLVNDGTNYRPTKSAATVAWTAGGIVSSARNVARWADALYGGDVISDEALVEMTDYLDSPYSNGTYGLGTRTRVLNGERMFGHTGSLRGFAASMWHYTDLDLTVVVLTNRGRIDPNPIADKLAGIARTVLP